MSAPSADRPAQETPGAGGPPASPPPRPGGSGASNMVMRAINSAIALVRSPAEYMAGSKDTPATVNGIMIYYVAVLAAIPFLATLIGDLWYYSYFLPIGFAGSYIAYAFTRAILTYVLDVVAVYVIAVVIGILAPTFGSSKDPIKSLKLASFVFTPVFLISILAIIPFLGVLTFLGVLYGLYILYLGMPILLGTPKEKVVTYVVAVVIATLIVYVIIGAIIGAISAAAFSVGMGFF